MKTTSPRALIVDDDTITLRFFEAAFAALGWSCATCGNAAQALTLGAREKFDVLILDRHLPDARGDVLLRDLRAVNITAPAIATSAEIDASVRDQLIAAGFDDVVSKPISLAALREVVTRCVGSTPTSTMILDDAGALDSLGGNREGLHALRTLLADELTELRSTYADNAAVDTEVFDGRLHRLRASCGFCGATALAAAAANLQTRLRKTPEVVRADIDAFFDVCAATASALRAAPTTAK